MENNYKEINDRIRSHRFLLNRYLEGKSIYERIIGVDNIVSKNKNSKDLDLYVKVNGLSKIDPKDINNIELYSSDVIERNIKDSMESAEMCMKKFIEYRERLDNSGLGYTEIAMTSYNSAIFMKYEKYMDGLRRLWKAKYLDEVDGNTPSIYISEKMKFLKSITRDDFYKDAVSLKLSICAFDEDEAYEVMDTKYLDKMTVNFNEFAELFEKMDTNIQMDTFYDEKELEKPFDYIVRGQTDNIFDRYFDFLYEKPEILHENKVLY